MGEQAALNMGDVFEETATNGGVPARTVRAPR